VALLSAVPAASAPAAVMISDFDPGGTYYGGIEGWFNYSGMPYLSTEASPPGGSTNWLAVGPTQYYENFTAQNWAVPDVPWSAFLSNTQIELDLIIPGSGPNAWYPSNPNQPISFELQFFGGSMGTVNSYPATTFNSGLKDQVIHVVVDYSSLTLDPTATGWNLSLQSMTPGYAWEWDASNPNFVPYGARFFVDNIQLTSIPEPVGLGVVALAGLMLRRRAQQ
jgi:hypothetical protein